MMRKLTTLCFFCSLLLVACTESVSLSLTPNTLQMLPGDIQTITLSGNASDVEWLSSNDSVASVFYGTVTAKAVGKAVITAKKGSTTATCEVFVTASDGSSLRISPAFVSLQKGDTYQFSYGNTYDLELTWSSSDESVARVDNSGMVTAIAPGNAVITLSTPVESHTAIVAVAHHWGEYKLVWSDEFNGTSLDESVWGYNTGGGGWGNNELQYYTTRTENIRVQNGCLEIEARKENYEERNYTSARILSRDKKTFTYGKIEARINFPGGQGTWPAFWMMGNKGSWPACGEIDIIEHIGSQPTRASFALHTPLKNGTRGNNWSATHFFDQSLAGGFHTYGVEWCQEEENGKDCIRFTVDGVVYATSWESEIDNDRAWPFNRAHFIIFNMAVGGSMGGTVDDAIFDTPRIMYVDWVRVYQREEIQ